LKNEGSYVRVRSEEVLAEICGPGEEVTSEVVEEKPERYFKKGFWGVAAIIVILVLIGALAWYTQTSPAKPVIIRKSGQVIEHYLYKNGVLVGIDCYAYIHNEGMSGSVTVQFTVTRVRDGSCLGKYFKIFHLKEGANAIITGRIDVNQLRAAGYFYKPSWEVLEYSFKIWTTKSGDKEYLDYPNRIRVEITKEG